MTVSGALDPVASKVSNPRAVMSAISPSPSRLRLTAVPATWFPQSNRKSPPFTLVESPSAEKLPLRSSRPAYAVTDSDASFGSRWVKCA